MSDKDWIIPDAPPEPIRTPVERGQDQAVKQFRYNQRVQLASATADLSRVKLFKGSPQARYDAYVRTYARLENIAQAIAEDEGVNVNIPAFDPPAVDGASATRTVKPTEAAEMRNVREVVPGTYLPEGAYRETGGMGPSGKGIPVQKVTR